MHFPFFFCIFLDMVYNEKYPSFWTGSNHTNENSNALFENISIEKSTPEFLFVERLFHQTVRDTQSTIAVVSYNLNK